MNSSLATLTVTSLVLSPAFDAGTLFYEVNATSLTYTVDASASSDTATGLEVDGKASPAIYTVHSTAPAYQEIRVLVSTRDATTTPVMLSTALVCVTRSGMDPVATPIVLEVCPATTRGCASGHPTGAVCATRRSVAQVATCEVVPIVLCILRAWKEAQTSTLSGRASARPRGREPDVTGAPVQILAPA